MALPEIGEILQAQVTHAESECVLLKSGAHTVYVPRLELFWPPWPVSTPGEAFPVGQVVDVLVTGYIYPRRQVLGSFKRIDPEANPFRKLARLDPGTAIDGVVDFVLPPPSETVSVRVSEGITGQIAMPNLHQRGFVGKLKPGDHVKVVIEYLDINKPELLFDIAES
jgi:ribosomal protein S1